MVDALRNVLKAVGLRRVPGLSGYNYYLLRMLKRPEWIYRGYSKIPFCPLILSVPSESTPSDVALCQRLITAYRKAVQDTDGRNDLSAMWSDFILRHGKRLIEGLRQDDPAPLVEALRMMFRESFVLGIATGDLYAHGRTWIGSRIWSLKCLDDLVSLAECLGVVRTECPEQGVLGYCFQGGLEALVAKIEASLGMEIGFPDIGSPYGIKVANRLITLRSPDHIYAAFRVNLAIESILNPNAAIAPNIVEIGGGFGAVTYWLLKLRKAAVRSYTVVDLPLINVLQGYFLSKAFGESMVALYGEGTEASASPKVITVLPTRAMKDLEGRRADVLLNQNSMPEMPEQAVVDYICWAKQNLKGIFYSYNHEAYSPVKGVPQVLVHEIVDRVGGFALLSRNPSWLRRGYVEEVYACRDGFSELTNTN